MQFFATHYSQHPEDHGAARPAIKWSRNLKRRLTQGRVEPFDPKRIRLIDYRPYHCECIYDSDLFVDERGMADKIFFDGNISIAICGVGSAKPFQVLASQNVFGVDFLEKTQGLPFRVAGSGDNITDWALKQFRAHYKNPVIPAKAGIHLDLAAVERKEKMDSGFRRNDEQKQSRNGDQKNDEQEQSGKDEQKQSRGKTKPQPITKQAIFHYVYAVLHDPLYREKYAQNLKREFPRIPMYGSEYADFWRWAEWGRELMELHIGYEAVAPWPLTRTDTPDEKARKNGVAPKAMLKADKETGRIALDSETVLTGIPAEAWTYKLGNRSALEWILDQYKERRRKTRPSAPSSTPTALPTTRKRSSIC